MANITVTADIDAFMSADTLAEARAAIGLGAVDNTSDANKPISTAVAAALTGKQATLVSGTNIKTINGVSIMGAGNLELNADTAEVEADILDAQADITALEASMSAVESDVANLDSYFVTAGKYDVVADNTTDVRTQLQAAINACMSTTETGSLVRTTKLKLPQGTMRISGPLTIKSGVVLEGDGIGTKIGPTAGFSGEALFIIDYGPQGYCQDASLTNIAFTGSVLAITDKYLSYSSASGVASTDVITISGHQFVNGQRVWIKPGTLTGGSGLTAGIEYFVRDVSGNTFKLAATSGGAAVNFGSDLLGATIETWPSTNLRCEYNNLFFETPDCIVLRNYNQATTFEKIYAGGATNKLIHFNGNWNQLRHINKEGVTGTSADPYIKLGPIYDGNRSTGNVIDGMNIEGLGSVNKTPMLFEQCNYLELRNMWCELQGTPGSITDGKVVHFKDCFNARIMSAPSFQIGLPDAKIKIENSYNIFIEEIDLDPTADNIYDVIDIDSTSNLTIGTLISRGNDSSLRCNEAKNIRIHRTFAKNNNLAPNTTQFTEVHYRGANRFVNGSFENLLRGWTIGTGGTPTSTLVDSGIAGGKALQVTISPVNSPFVVYQTVAFNSDQVGKPWTFTGAVKTSAASGCAIRPYVSGCGVDMTTQLVNFAREGDWTIISQTFVPQTAGSCDIGAYCSSLTTAWFDEFSVCAGVIGSLSSSAMQELELNGGTITRGSAAPLSGEGTWRVGDLRFNSEPAANEYVGWICTVAGNPGTWVPFGQLSILKRVFGTSGGKQIEMNAEGDPFFKIWNEATNKGWQVFHFSGMNYLDWDDWQIRNRQTGDIWDYWTPTFGRQICNTASQKLGFWGTTPVVQPTAVANATNSTDVVDRFNELLARLRAPGVIAT